MSTPVDLRELAIDRGDTAGGSVRRKRHLVSRYLLPLVLVGGFGSLVAWAARDMVFPPMPVTVMPVISTTAEIRQSGTPLFQAAGWIEPRPTPIRVPALEPGVVERLLVVEDQVVTQGESVAELVKDDAQLNYERAVADRDLRDAELEEADAQLRAAETRLKQPVHLEAALREAEGALAKIQTQLRNLPFELRRAIANHDAMQRDYQGKLAAQSVVAKIEIDLAKGKADSAAALVAELRDREQSLQTEQIALTARRDALNTRLELLADEKQAQEAALAQVKAAKARVEQARVAVAEAQLRLDRMTIRAPVAGRVYQLIAHPGARIGSGMTQMEGHDGSTIVTMYQPEMLQVRVDVRFEDIPNVTLHQPVEINNPALSQPIIGNVLFVSSAADIQKNTLEVKVAIPSPPAVFKPEMLVDVTFLAPDLPASSAEPTPQRRLMVPRQLVKSTEGGKYIWVADQSEGVARKVTIETGTESKGLIEVKSGLTLTSRLIVSGSDQLRDGQRIVVTGDDPTLEPNRGGDNDGTTN